MTSLATLKREIQKIKQKQLSMDKDKPEVIVIMWSPDRGDGKEGLTRLNLKTGEKTPIISIEEKGRNE